MRAGRIPMREERRRASYHSIVNGEIEVKPETGLERVFVESEKNTTDVKDNGLDKGNEDEDGQGEGIMESNEPGTSSLATGSNSQWPTSLVYPPPDPFCLSSFFSPDEVGFGTRSQPESAENMFRYYQASLWSSNSSSQRFTMSQRDIKLIH
ncbi:hypothetical protein PQX77_010641 [Marasmius sp. AFHP31]|nr:hypothetical protein PQX77_010641 [Marasmius sp. AFHP31]